MNKVIKYSLIMLLSIVFGNTIHAQVTSNKNITNTIAGTNAFLDASTGFGQAAGLPPNQGVGLIFPTVNLVTFEFDLTLADGVTFPTWFDGMIVYNNTTGTTQTTGNRSATATAVTPGYYYFSNPDGATNGNVTGGVWKPLGGGSGSGSSLTSANNGLTQSGSTVLLGGTLTQATAIAQAGFNLYTTGTGKVSVGAAPTTSSAKFEVNGAATNTSSYNAGAGTTIDFSQSNLAYTSASAGAFTLTNLKDGGTYTLAVQGTTSGTASFTATNTAAAAVTVKIVNSMPTVAGKQTLYTIIVMGTTAYVFENTGF